MLFIITLFILVRKLSTTDRVNPEDLCEIPHMIVCELLLRVHIYPKGYDPFPFPAFNSFHATIECIPCDYHVLQNYLNFYGYAHKHSEVSIDLLQEFVISNGPVPNEYTPNILGGGV